MSDVFDESKAVEVMTKRDIMLAKALDSGNVDALERIINLRREEEDRAAKKEYDFHFSEMQKDIKPVPKTQPVWNKEGTKILYKFAPLREHIRINGDTIHRHGFAWRWYEESKEGSKEKRVYCVLSGWGWEKSCYVDIPINDSNSFTNSIQQRGVSTTYGKRYSFENILGLQPDDEETDGINLEIDDAMQSYRAKIDMAGNLDELLIAYHEAFDRYKNESDKKALVIGWYNIARAKFKESK